MPGKPHGLRSLAGYSPWGHKESNTAERVRTHTHTHTTEYYSVIKKNEIMSAATTWMDLEIVILSELSQTVKCHMTSVTCRI